MHFKAQMERGDGKEIGIETPDSDLRIYVDNDDVNRATSIPLLERMLAILNDHWDDEEYAHLKPLDCGESYEDWEKVNAEVKKRLEALMER